MNQIKIIHVAAIILDAQFFLDQVVESIGVKNGGCLGHLASQAQGLARAENRNEPAYQVPYSRIGYMAFHQCKKSVMPDIVKELGKIDKQGTAFSGKTVSAVKLGKAGDKTVDRKTGAFPFHGRAVIIN
jgi:hypothetical protein